MCPTTSGSRSRHLEHNFHTVDVNYGFMDEPNIPRALAQLRLMQFRFNLLETSFFVGREKVVFGQVRRLVLDLAQAALHLHAPHDAERHRIFPHSRRIASSSSAARSRFRRIFRGSGRRFRRRKCDQPTTRDTRGGLGDVRRFALIERRGHHHVAFGDAMLGLRIQARKFAAERLLPIVNRTDQHDVRLDAAAYSAATPDVRHRAGLVPPSETRSRHRAARLLRTSGGTSLARKSK